MGVNSVRADKLSAIVSRMLNKKEAFISGRFYVSAVAKWHSFQSDIFKGKKYENCWNVLWRLRGTKLKCNLIKSDFQRVRGFFLFLSIFGEVVLCKKVNLQLL